MASGLGAEFIPYTKQEISQGMDFSTLKVPQSMQQVTESWLSIQEEVMVSI